MQASGKAAERGAIKRAECACRWAGNNGPEQADFVAVRNLIDATPRTVKRFLLTTSAGVDRSDKLPFSILNLFGARMPAFSRPSAFYCCFLCQHA
jgi:hypothetical protein